jgi:glycosyltransferase involved in cell wall biosynthesis
MDGTGGIVEQNVGDLTVSYVYEPAIGLNRARNAGYSHCRAAYVAHLDADARIDMDWVENILRVIEERAPDLFGGPYIPYYMGTKPEWFLDRYYSNDLGTEAKYLHDSQYISGTSMVWRRQVVEDLGGFRPEIGLVGRGLIRGDETSLIARARRKVPRFRIFYEPRIGVQSLVREECFSIWYWLRRSFADGRLHRTVREIDDLHWPRLRGIVRIGTTTTGLVREALTCLFLRDKKRYPSWRNYWYERLLPLFYTLGISCERAGLCRPKVVRRTAGLS